MKQRLMKLLTELALIDSLIGMVGIGVILIAALFMQFHYGEAPCPLCLLQRAAFVGIGLSLFMNLRYGNRVVHWALAIISAGAGMAVSIRQILLHITSDTGFGSAVLGLHMYTWCFFGFAITIIGSAIMLLVYPEKRRLPRPV